MKPWNDWYHVMGHTYGTWLPGDKRGFRTRHHREHVEGDYRNPPPPGKYEELYQRSRNLLKREPVYLTQVQRLRAAEAFAKSLLKRKLPLIVISVDRIHYHILVKCSDRAPRKWVGIAKKESSHYLKEEGLAPVGGLWAVRNKCLPIKDRSHQLSVANYILSHHRKGGAIWRLDRNT